MQIRGTETRGIVVELQRKDDGKPVWLEGPTGAYLSSGPNRNSLFLATQLQGTLLNNRHTLLAETPAVLRAAMVTAALRRNQNGEFVNSKLADAFEAFTAADWLRKHTAVSDEDFGKDPTRNRLAVVLSRTNHVSYHSGQAILAG